MVRFMLLTLYWLLQVLGQFPPGQLPSALEQLPRGQFPSRAIAQGTITTWDFCITPRIFTPGQLLPRAMIITNYSFFMAIFCFFSMDQLYNSCFLF